jgi:ribonucleotide reductase alpha subunit
MPDGRGGKAMFDCKPLWRLLISSSGLYQLRSTGFRTHRLHFDVIKPQRDAAQFVTVVLVEDRGRVDDPFCFNEPINHARVFEGICTGQCMEIVQYTSPDEVAICTLSSLVLPKFVVVELDSTRWFDHAGLFEIMCVATRNLNQVIDLNFYAIPEAARSSYIHRAIRIGAQGLADTFILMRYPWSSEEARALNRDIFETIYYAALVELCHLAAQYGPYESYNGSPVSQGILQPDMWGVMPLDRWDWAEL